MATTKSRDSVSSKSESMDGNHVTFSFFTDQSSSCLPGKLHALTSCGSLHGGSSPLQPAIMGGICHGSQQLNMQPRCKSKIPISPMTSFSILQGNDQWPSPASLLSEMRNSAMSSPTAVHKNKLHKIHLGYQTLSCTTSRHSLFVGTYPGPRRNRMYISSQSVSPSWQQEGI